MSGKDDEPPSDPDTGPEAVKEAMRRRRPVKASLKVIDGGKQPSSAPKRTRGPKAVAPPEDADDDTDADDAPDYPEEQDEYDARPVDLDEDEWDAARECCEYDQNDRHNGFRLIVWFGGDLAYVPGMGWLTFRGTHWQRDDGELGARLLAQNVVDKIKLEPFHIRHTPAQQRLVDAAGPLRRLLERTKAQESLILRADKVVASLSTKRSARKKFAVSSGNANKTGAMLTQAASHKAIDQNLLDADHLKFNLRSGTLHFSRRADPEQDLTPEADGTPIKPRLVGHFEHLPHDRADMMTKLAEVDWDPEAECPRFMAFLEKMQPKPIMRQFLQVFHAYALMIGGNGAQKLVYHYGLGGNGKTAFIEAVGRMAGTYRTTVSPDTITGDSQRQGQQASPDIARLFNTRFVVVEELPKSVPLKEDMIKAFSGGSKLTARFLQKDTFEFLPIFTAVLSGNHKPTIYGADYGIWRRVLLVLWGVTIAEDDPEKLEFDDLMAIFDSERSGILNWLIEGAVLYLGKGLVPFIPPEVTAFTQEYRKDRDNVGVYAEVGIEKAPGETIRAGILYKDYTDWCESNGLTPAKLRGFGDRLTELGFEKITGRNYVYQNVKLTGASSAKYDPPPPKAADPGDPGWSPKDL